MPVLALSGPWSDLLHLVRWRDWAQSKLPTYLVAVFYGLGERGPPDAADLAEAAALVLLLCLYAAFGHIVNDYADREADRAAGKQRLIASLGEGAALTAVALPAAGAGLLALLVFDLGTAALTAAALAIATVYSLPPGRLKERGYWGWLAATLAQRTLPFAAIFQALGAWDWVAVLLVLHGSLLGLRFIAIHQILDRRNDRRAGVRTVATVEGADRLRDLVRRAVFPAELATAAAAVMLMAVASPAVVLAPLAVLPLLALSRRRGHRLDPLSYATLYEFYCVAWPIALALALAVQNPLLLAAVLGAVWLVEAKALEIMAFHLSAPPPRPPSPPPAPPEAEPRPAVLSKADPYPFYARLRKVGPVVRFEWPGLGTTWLVTRHAAATAVLKDPRFVSGPAGLARANGRAPPPARPARGFGPDLVELDPPDHTRLRRLVSKAFTPRTVERLDGRVEALAGELLDRARPDGRIELIGDFAAVVPITVITELLGVPVGDIGRFRTFVHALSTSQALGRRNERLEQAKARFTDHLHAIFEERRRQPRDDLVTALVQAEQDGDRLSPDELLGMVYLLLLGGFITTVNLVGNGTMALLRHPEQFDLLRRHPDLAEGAVEELLRYDSPLELSSVHLAAADMELHGRRLPLGAPVRILIPAANRDPDVFADPDRLDLRRTPCPHLSFGQGIHYCLGAPLARLEARIMFRLLAERLPDLRLDEGEPLQWLPHPVLRGLRRLPLRFA
ncbi:cytochrome P450 [Stella sp.]|uniref:cytochrome P450 n=1 Tax=Stella sp. TaxID=2912054 RepID=UPI0035B20856